MSIEALIEAVRPFSKAIAGAISGIIISFAIHMLGNSYTIDFGNAVSTIVNVLVPVIIGFAIVFFAPKNTK